MVQNLWKCNKIKCLLVYLVGRMLVILHFSGLKFYNIVMPVAEIHVEN